MPVSGLVVKINEALKDTPALVNKSPADEGWLAQIELTNASELDGLMTEAQYAEFLKSEDH